MKTWASVFNVIALLVLCMLLTVYFNLSRMCERDLDQIIYNYAVRQATEAMFCETLTSEDIDMDYDDRGYLAINSSNALETYCRVLCYNYDIAISEENFAAIRNSIKVCALCGFDGFYVAQTFATDSIEDNEITKDGYDLSFGLKHPYTIEANGNIYMLNTYNESYTFLSADQDNADRVVISSVYGYPAGITSDLVQRGINNCVRSAVLEELENAKNVNGDETDFRLYLPEVTTLTGVNPVRPPCVLLIADSMDFVSDIKITATAVSGYTVVMPTYVIGIKDVKTGKYYYCYETQMNSAEESSFEVVDYFSDIETAAAAETPAGDGTHYAPHFDLMTRKITQEGV